MKRILILLLLISCSVNAYGQCKIKNRLSPNNVLVHYMDPIRVFWTESKSLYCATHSDGEHYFLELYPKPFPALSKPNKLNDPAVVTLANENEYSLEHFDTRYLKEDSSMIMLFMIGESELEQFRSVQISKISINLGDESGNRKYLLKLHKDAISTQLKCLDANVNEK